MSGGVMPLVEMQREYHWLRVQRLDGKHTGVDEKLASKARMRELERMMDEQASTTVSRGSKEPRVPAGLLVEGGGRERVEPRNEEGADDAPSPYPV